MTNPDDDDPPDDDWDEQDASGESKDEHAEEELPGEASGSLTADELLDEQGRESFPASDPPAH